MEFSRQKAQHASRPGEKKAGHARRTETVQYGFSPPTHFSEGPQRVEKQESDITHMPTSTETFSELLFISAH